MNEFIQAALPQYLFLAFCTLAICSAIGVVVLRSPVSSAFSLILVLLNVAGMFAMQGAYFVAAVQVLVYAGAIMVLFIFVIMLLSVERVEIDWPTKKAFLPVPVALATALFLGLGAVLARGGGAVPGQFSREAVEASGGNVRVVSELMFSDYSLPFLVMGMMLSVCIVGAVLLAKRKVD